MVKKYNTVIETFFSDTVLASRKAKMNRNDAYLAFTGTGSGGILEIEERSMLQGNVRRSIIEANATCRVVLKGEARGEWRDQESIPKYVIISEFLIGSMKVKAY